MNLSWKRVLAVTVGAICLIVASLPGSVEAHGKHPGRARRVKSCTTKGDVRMTRSVAGHTVNYALGRHQLQDRVTPADIDRAVSEMYNFLKRKLGNPTAVCAQYISTGYGHFERAYGDEARAMLLGESGLKANGASSKFNVKRHAFHFQNYFEGHLVAKLPFFGEVNFANSPYGLCGGMIYAAHDSYWTESTSARTTTSPQQTTIPGPGSRLRQYLWDRQMDSLKGPKKNWAAVLKLAQWLAKPVREVEGLSMREFNKTIRPGLDKGWAIPLMVVISPSFSKNHQVLAIGYEWDSNENEWDIIVYDPNFPNSKSRMNTRHKKLEGKWKGQTYKTAFRGFFVTSYRGKRPYWAPGERTGPSQPGGKRGSPRDPWGTGGKGPAQPETLPKDPR